MILWGEFTKTSQFHCLFCVVVWDFTQWATSETIFLLGPAVNLPLFNCFTSARPHLIHSSQHAALSIHWGETWERGEEGGLQTNQAQISLRRDICSETISQVVICGIIASPTHKCMGVCVHVVCLCVCVAYGGPRSVRLIAWQDYKFCGALPPC